MFYGNVDGFKEYFTLRGKTIPEEWTDEKIESTLLISSEWLDSRYENIWIGYKVAFKQERSWPRQSAVVESFPYYVYGVDEIPEEVIKATYEASYRELEESGYLRKDYTANLYDSVSIDGAISIKYNNTVQSLYDIQNKIDIIDSLMFLLIDNSKNGSFNSSSGSVERV